MGLCVTFAGVSLATRTIFLVTHCHRRRYPPHKDRRVRPSRRRHRNSHRRHSRGRSTSDGTSNINREARMSKRSLPRDWATPAGACPRALTAGQGAPESSKVVESGCRPWPPRGPARSPRAKCRQIGTLLGEVAGLSHFHRGHFHRGQFHRGRANIPAQRCRVKQMGCRAVDKMRDGMACVFGVSWFYAESRGGGPRHLECCRIMCRILHR